MLTLHIEADTYPELLAKAEKELGGPLNISISDPIVQLNFPAGPKAPAPISPAAPTTERAEPNGNGAAPAAAVGGPSLPAPEPRKRPGRPRKTDSQAPAAAPSGEAAVPAPKAPEPTTATAAPQVAVGNTTSAPPVAPPAEGAPAAPAAQAAVGSSGSVPTLDQVRAAASKVNDKHGMTAVVNLLKKYGAERMSGVAEAKRSEFIAECEKLAA